MAETPYAETEVLVAVMNGDHTRTSELLSDFLPGELRTFLHQVCVVRDEIRYELARRDDA